MQCDISTAQCDVITVQRDVSIVHSMLHSACAQVTYSFGCVGHWFRKLVRKKSQHCSERAQASSKQNEERKFFFGINGELMVT